MAGKSAAELALVAMVVVGVVAPAMCRPIVEFSDQKNFFPADPHLAGSPPSPVLASPQSGGGSYSSGSPYHSTPASPYTPAVPSISTPPATPDPGRSSGTCSYWANHPQAIRTAVGWETVSQCFGITCVTVFGWDPTLHAALANDRADGIGALFREGTAAYLNSVVDRNFPLTTQQVRNAFVSAVASDGAAAAQAELFKKANQGMLKI